MDVSPRGRWPLIKSAIWGKLASADNNLLDGGSVTALHFAFYNPEGQWEAENHGVDQTSRLSLTQSLA
jgi:tricorn protease